VIEPQGVAELMHGHGQKIPPGCGDPLLPGFVVVDMHVPGGTAAIRWRRTKRVREHAADAIERLAAVWRVAVVAPSETDLDVGRVLDLAKHEWNDRCPPLPCIGDDGALARRKQVGGEVVDAVGDDA
jgi:hypothetical protein